jgi:hypothetical protein
MRENFGMQCSIKVSGLIFQPVKIGKWCKTLKYFSEARFGNEQVVTRHQAKDGNG